MSRKPDILTGLIRFGHESGHDGMVKPKMNRETYVNLGYGLSARLHDASIAVHDGELMTRRRIEAASRPAYSATNRRLFALPQSEVQLIPTSAEPAPVQPLAAAPVEQTTAPVVEPVASQTEAQPALVSQPVYEKTILDEDYDVEEAFNSIMSGYLDHLTGSEETNNGTAR